MGTFGRRFLQSVCRVFSVQILQSLGITTSSELPNRDSMAQPQSYSKIMYTSYLYSLIYIFMAFWTAFYFIFLLSNYKVMKLSLERIYGVKKKQRRSSIFPVSEQTKKNYLETQFFCPGKGKINSSLCVVCVFQFSDSQPVVTYPGDTYLAMSVCCSSRAAVTKCHGLGGLMKQVDCIALVEARCSRSMATELLLSSEGLSFHCSLL